MTEQGSEAGEEEGQVLGAGYCLVGSALLYPVGLE